MGLPFRSQPASATACLIAAISICVLIGTAGGATRHVPGEYPTIQAAIAAAADGDTVLVGPGVYQEALTWANKDLTLLGDGTPESVVIRPPSAERVILLGPGVTQRTRLRHLTIRDGRAADGAGIQLVGASPAIQYCRFETNVAAVPPQGGPSRGGALFVSSGSSPVVTDCSFIQNQSRGSDPFIERWGEGGAVYVESDGSLNVRRCHFEGNQAWGAPEGGVGGGMYLSGVGVIDSCTFKLNGFAYGAGVYSEWQVDIRNCIFQDNHGWSGAALYAGGRFSIENSQFFDNVTVGTEGGALTALGTGLITNNTIGFNESWNEMAGVWAPRAFVTNNIICQNLGWGVIGCPENPPDFSCNDVWGNTIDGNAANYNGCDLTGMNGNISSDPLFCAPEDRDLTLHANSPCAAPSCGRMGALGVGCGVGAIAEGAASPRIPCLRVIPNPIRHSATFAVEPGVKGLLLDIYDVQGRLLEVLHPNGAEVVWTPPRSATNGVYFSRARGTGTSETVKFLVLR